MRTAWDAWPTSDLASSYPPRSIAPGAELRRSKTRPGSPPPVNDDSTPSFGSPSLEAAALSQSPPSFGINRSYALTARLERMNSPPQAVLPAEIIRKIIHAALALPKGYPDRIPRVDELPTPAPSPSVHGSSSAFPAQRFALEENPFSEGDGPSFAEGHWDPNWDQFGGRTARKLAKDRDDGRARVARDARALMCVCRTWKGLVTRYLYAEPQLSGENVAALTDTVVHGDRKWSDINLHPHSVPGRWITTLDLSRLDPGALYLGAGATTVMSALAALLDLTPSVAHLRLPPSGVSLQDLRHSPCMRSVRALEGVHLHSAEEDEDAIRLLRATRKLEFLGVVWVGARPEDDEEELPSERDAGQKKKLELNLPHLHSVTFVNPTAGPLLAALTAAELPNLTRWVTSPYPPSLIVHTDDALRGGPRAFQAYHGHKIRSLTFVAVPDYPRRDLLPPADSLTFHPHLEHVHLALPHRLLHDHASFASAFFTRRVPVLTIPRWPRVVQNEASASPHAAQEPQDGRPQGNAFLHELASSGVRRVDKVVVDGFTWVPPSLGRWAAESGDCAMMRTWAHWLATRGIELLDQDGAGIPAYERGRAARRPSENDRRGSEGYMPVPVGRGRGKGGKGRRVSLGTYGQSGFGMTRASRRGADEDGG